METMVAMETASKQEVVWETDMDRWSGYCSRQTKDLEKSKNNRVWYKVVWARYEWVSQNINGVSWPSDILDIWFN